MTLFTDLIDSLKGIDCVQQAAVDAEWEEGKHPRSDDGKFSSGKGGVGKPSAVKGGASANQPRKFKFRVNGEVLETTATSYAQAHNNISYKASGGNPMTRKDLRVEFLSVDGQKPKVRVIIDNDDPKRFEQIKNLTRHVASLFDRQAGNQGSDTGRSEPGVGNTPTDESIPDTTGDLPDAHPRGEGGSGGRNGHNDKIGLSGSGAKRGSVTQALFPFAQDAAPLKKKVFYVSLIASLRKIADGKASPANAIGLLEKISVNPELAALIHSLIEEQRPTDGQSEANEGEKTGEIVEERSLTQSPARENEEKDVVIPSDGGERFTPEEAEKIVVEERIPGNPVDGIPRMSSREVRDMIKGNCSLIKTVDKDRIPGIERRIKRIFERGNSTPDTLARYLEKECDLEPWQADRIVNDQMNKYQAKANLERLKRQGVKLVKWCHGGSHDPREYHLRQWDGHSGLHNGHPNGLAGFIFSIDDPPVIDEATGARGFPGDLINCSCYLESAD